jgi:hypothetical protein
MGSLPVPLITRSRLLMVGGKEQDSYCRRMTAAGTQLAQAKKKRLGAGSEAPFT